MRPCDRGLGKAGLASDAAPKAPHKMRAEATSSSQSTSSEPIWAADAPLDARQLLTPVVKKKTSVDSPWVTASTSIGSNSTFWSFHRNRTMDSDTSTPCSSTDEDLLDLPVKKLPFPHSQRRIPDLEQPLMASSSILDGDQQGPIIDPDRVYWESFFVVLPMFCGLASLFGLQHHVKAQLRIQDDSSSASFEFGFAVTAVYMGNLFARFGHNLFLFWISPRRRVFLSMGFMLTSMFIISVMIFALSLTHMAWVVLAYCMGGLGIGTFESNVLACLTPLGHRTKQIAITAIPVGIAIVMIGGFGVMGSTMNLSPLCIYACVAVLLLLGMFTMAYRIPHSALTSSPGIGPSSKLHQFRSDLRQFRKWFPRIWHYALATTLDMFSVSAFSPGLILYVYNSKTVTVLPNLVLKTDTFMAVANFGMFTGGLIGRWLSYRLRPRHPLVYAIINFTGVAILLSFVPILAPLGMFLVMFGDGLIYGTVSKYIDTILPDDFNLIAISAWLFIGDLGSIAGSSSVTFLRLMLIG